jgi:dihydrofolate reductase
MINPIVLGTGNPLFKGNGEMLKMKLLKTKTFRNGNVLLYYQPDGK